MFLTKRGSYLSARLNVENAAGIQSKSHHGPAAEIIDCANAAQSDVVRVLGYYVSIVVLIQNHSIQWVLLGVVKIILLLQWIDNSIHGMLQESCDRLWLTCHIPIINTHRLIVIQSVSGCAFVSILAITILISDCLPSMVGLTTNLGASMSLFNFLDVAEGFRG